MSGFIIWYKLEIEKAGPLGLVPLLVSNDMFSGQYILDADITLPMSAGATADTFKINIYNLPMDVAESLKTKHSEGLEKKKPLTVKVFLGYFDTMPMLRGQQAVMTGAITGLKSSVGEDGILATELSGQEIAGYKLRTSCVAEHREGSGNLYSFVSTIAQEAGVDIADGSRFSQEVSNFTLPTTNGLDALRQIAGLAGKPLVVTDGKIYIGQSVGKEQAPEPLDPDTNLVSQELTQSSEEKQEPCTDRSGGQVQTTSKARAGLEIVALGDPRLRVGQTVVVKTNDLKGKLRINRLTHRFSTKNGYTCDMTVVEANPGEPAPTSGGVQGVVDRLRDVTEGTLNNRTAIDVGEVTSYEAGSRQKHLATLNYGQSPPQDAVAPSVEVAVDTSTQLHNKPLAAPFAFHKCGLVVPVYAKMRALLAHNRGLGNDAVVAGFLWSENPKQDRPANEPGDYWLCLPTQIGGDGLPTGKGVNDLTTAAGLRVIQAKGLRIVAGTDSLPDVGARPTVHGDLENTLVIEHQSGTKISIKSDGAVEITTSTKDISLSNGTVSLKLSGPGVEVS